MWRLTNAKRMLTASTLVVLLIGVLVGGYLLNTRPNSDFVQAQGDQPPAVQELFQPFWETWNLLHDNYVDPINDQSLMESALQGMVAAAEQPDAQDVIDPALPESFGQAVGEQTTDDINELFAPFWASWDLLHDAYGDALDDTALMEGALRGMLESLGDPHTDYMDPETYAQIMQAMSSEYEGIGATVRQNEDTGGLELISIMEGSPAEKAGLRAGDEIVMVDGEDVTELSQNEIIALVRGPAGSTVELGIRRPKESNLLDFDVVRERINVPSVSSEMLEDDIAYVRLSQFDLDTGTLLRGVINELDANTLNGLVLDVRSNPGGYLTTSIDVASVFISEGPVVIERGPNREQTYQALGNANAADVPMVVLVDQGSASASELIAGALQDRGRATVVGMPTFGKGSVQTWRELSNGGGVRITISRWYTPDGRSVSAAGIDPDIVVPFEVDSPDDEDPQLQTALSVLKGTYSE
jgi:carboxyl-terminal processing protease